MGAPICWPEPVPGVVRRRYVSRVWRGVLGVSAAVIAVAGCGTTRAGDLQRPEGAAARAAPAWRTITIDPQVGETFAPAPASAAPKLTAQQAWARYARENGSDHAAIPSVVHVRLGLLTLPVGPANAPGTSNLTISNGEAYTALNELAYGYSSPSGCVSMNPWVLFPPDARCIEWDFLNANTGTQIDSTWQKIGHWHMLMNPNARLPHPHSDSVARPTA
jgi:hypothetical protein